MKSTGTPWNKPVAAIILLLTIVLNPHPAAPRTNVPVKYKLLETGQFAAQISNDGRLGFTRNGYAGILYPGDTPSPLVFDHGLWIFAMRNDTLTGVAPYYYLPNYSPGPIIHGEAAAVTAPEDTALFRTYQLTRFSGPGDLDYDTWPSHLGAPVNPDGTPRLHGDAMLWTVYNDADPNLHGFLEDSSDIKTNTQLEIRETVWGYDSNDISEDFLFFKWQIYNKSESRLDSVMICLWNDIDLWNASYNHVAYDIDKDFGYVYYDGSASPPGDSFALSGAYVMMQGPVVPSSGATAMAFGSEMRDMKNLSANAFWGIIDDAYPPEGFGGSPKKLQDAYRFMTGRRHDGSPIVNPVTGDTTALTFTGDPLSGEGWLMQGSGGGAGYIIGSGPITMAPGDSQEVIFALAGATGATRDTSILRLFDKIDSLKTRYPELLSRRTPFIQLPEHILLSQNYPNPFNGKTIIRYELPQAARVKLTIFNILGQEVNTLVDHDQPTDFYAIVFNANDLASGVYFYRLTVDTGDVKTIDINKMLLLR
ncbi:MAG: T9SS type A sorting domain-containing protein [candidate division KSB1 bacterium]|jgi:hypothetical protein|nr:T9SS type A sorting domain-containing protein [candidate division KSB1 bacterium]